MFDYLQQFNRLPKELKDAVSSPEAMKSLDEIESKFGVKLAAAVMRIMVKDLPIVKLPLFLASEFLLNEDDAKKISEELENGVLKKVASYLGFAPVVSANAFEDKVANILKTGIVSFSSQALIDRFSLIAKTYLNGVRAKIDTRLAMQKSVEAGGLGLSIEKADQVLNLLEGKNQPASLPKKSSALDSLIAKHTIQPEYSLAAAIEERKKKLLAEKELPAGEKPTASLAEVPSNLPFEKSPKTSNEEVATPEELAAFLKKISQTLEPEKPIAPVAVQEKTVPEKKSSESEIKINISQAPKAENSKISQPPAKVSEVPSGVSFQAVPTANLVTPPRPANYSSLKIAPVTASGEQGRVRMDDVRMSPKIMGPIEELRFLDLVNFRRLSTKPTEATAKILAKIKLLEKSGYDRMTAGISAWRQSETNHLYLKMYRESAFKSKSLAEIIESYREKNLECLTEEEVDAIMEMNAKLLF